jgi:hypothetical protein
LTPAITTRKQDQVSKFYWYWFRLERHHGVRLRYESNVLRTIIAEESTRGQAGKESTSGRRKPHMMACHQTRIFPWTWDH